MEVYMMLLVVLKLTRIWTA